MPDSLKAQHTAHYTRGHVLMSDMGRALASITADSLGWHDPLGLLLDDERMATAKYGEHSYQEARNGMYRSGKHGLLIEIGKYGLTTARPGRAATRAAHAHHRRRHLRPPRHAGRRLRQPRATPCATRWTSVHAQLPRQLPARHAARRRACLGKRDLVPNINFFMNVPVTPEGGD
jgi:hypothetical protein